VAVSQKDEVSEAEIASRLLHGIEALLDQMIEQQRAKVLHLAREALPHLSPEDVMNPFDFPELKAHPTFDYEDGILAGLISAQIALRAELRSPERALPGEG
jgi:hypothetical protein